MAGIYRDVNKRRLPLQASPAPQTGVRGTPTTGCSRLDEVSQRLRTRRYLMGDHITDADIRLFTTLVRFDPCTTALATAGSSPEMPVLWAYARDLFQTRGSATRSTSTTSRRTTTGSTRDINPTGIIPLGPDLADWMQPHGRRGARRISVRGGDRSGPLPSDEGRDGTSSGRTGWAERRSPAPADLSGPIPRPHRRPCRGTSCRCG